ncbi:hypothetical protein PIB30_000041 [Stylosanthes scabra]|uniref:Uncharacterized protein n=1 Tax=Stylosanthes scabra TaxID=79078 RepID=A0ABU6Q1X5_9FABA|nr:hypothetical protein [Stylosanthes scabra]
MSNPNPSSFSAHCHCNHAAAIASSSPPPPKLGLRSLNIGSHNRLRSPASVVAFPASSSLPLHRPHIVHSFTVGDSVPIVCISEGWLRRV